MPSPYGRQRPVRHPRDVRQGVLQLSRQPGLPDAGAAENREQAPSSPPARRHRRPAAAARPRPRRPTSGESERARDTQRALDDLEQAPRAGHRPSLPLNVERPGRLHPDGVAHEPSRRVADQDLTGPGRLLEAGRDVHRVAGDEGLSVGWVAGHHLARVHARAQAELDALLPFKLAVEIVDGVAASRPPPARRGARRPRARRESRRPP